MRQSEDNDRPARVATVGFQGFGNVGDEAILAGIAVLLGDRARVVTVFSGGREAVAAFPGAERVATARHLPTPAAWRHLRRVDALVLSGGGLINDYWPAVIPRYVLWCVAARVMGARVVWVGSGIGPIRRRPWRWLAGLGFGVSRLVAVRDPESAAWIARCPGRPRVSVVPDPAFFVDVPSTPSRLHGVGIGVVARGPALIDDARGRELALALATAASELVRRGERVELISLHPSEDAAFFADLQATVTDLGGEPLPVTWLPPDPSAAIAFLGSFERLVTVRLHGLILGALAGVPSVAIGYDAKVHQAANRLGLGDVAVALDDVSATALTDALDRLANRPARRTELALVIAGIRAQCAAVSDLVISGMR